MADHVVIDHHHDEAAGIYKLVTGIPIVEAQPLTDADGITLLDDDDQPLTEQVTVGYEDVVDVVFDDTDKRWEGRMEAEVAALQRDLVRAAILKRSEPTSDDTSRTEMPGVGDTLDVAP